MTGTGEGAKRGRAMRRGIAALAAALLLAVGLGAAGLMVSGRTFDAPPWLQTRIEARIAGLIPGLRLEFGRLSLTLAHDGHPRVELRDVALSRPEGGGAVATLGELDATLALRALIRGRLEPRSLHLSGAILTLRRDARGRLDLALGDALGAGNAGDLPGLVRRIDTALATPGLAYLGTVEARAVTLRYEDARAGRAWTADGGRLRLSREGGRLRVAGDFALLSGRALAATLEVNAESVVGSAAIAFGMSFEDMASRDIATQSAALAWLEVLRAPIAGALRGELDETGALGPLHATLQIGEGVLQPSDATRPIPFRSARSYFTYEPSSATLRFDEFALESDWISARAEGTATLRGLETGWPTELLLQGRIANIAGNPEGLYAAPVQIAGAQTAMRLRLDPFELTIGQMVLDDPRVPLHLSGSVRAEADGWHFALDARAERLDHAQIAAWWPPGWKPATRGWIERNIRGGTLHRPHAALRSQSGQTPDIYLGSAFAGAMVGYMPTMPPIEAATGYLSLHGHRFAVSVEEGRVAGEGAPVRLDGSGFVVPDIRIEDAPAELHLVTDGGLSDTLRLLDRPPFALMARAGRSPDIAEGRAQLEADLAFPLIRDLKLAQVAFDVSGRLSELSSEALVPGRSLRAEALSLTADPGRLEIAGAVRLGAVPFEGRWTLPLGAPVQGSRVVGDVALGPDFLREFGIALPEGTVAGASRARVEIDLAKDTPPAFSLSSDLSGLRLRLPQIGWSLGQGETGTLDVSGRLSAPVRIDRVALDAPGLSAVGRVELGEGGAFRLAAFERVRAGGWLDGPVTLGARGPGAAPSVEVLGGQVDLRAMPDRPGGEDGGGGGGPLTLSLDSLVLSEGIRLTAFRGAFDGSRGLDGAFTALVNGAAPIRGQLVPRQGRSAVRILSDDAGAVLRASGILRQAHGGALDLTLLPGPEPGTQDGIVRATDVRLRDAPAMAAMLNAISIVGLLEQLGGPGIAFSEVEARFRLTPSRVILSSGSAVGPSMGLSMDGYYDLASGAMDMQGVLSPIYMLNVLGSVLTRKGEGLIGFNFRLQGQADRPRVTVNPLSVLTPGMFREIFRRPPPRLSQ